MQDFRVVTVTVMHGSDGSRACHVYELTGRHMPGMPRALSVPKLSWAC